MIGKKSIWRGKVVKAELLGKSTYRRLHFKNVTNEDDIIMKESFFIDESENLRAINSSILITGDIVSFEVDKNFNVTNFCYPHDSRAETYAKIQQKGKSILEKVRERRRKNERSEP